jgi:hypothetical protein
MHKTHNSTVEFRMAYLGLLRYIGTYEYCGAKCFCPKIHAFRASLEKGSLEPYVSQT